MSFQERYYYIYIMANDWNTVLYTGMTNNLHRRVLEHKSGRGGKFTAKYRVRKLVYFEATTDVEAAILREKQIKAGSRKKKVELIESVNGGWKDLSREIGL
jgi:putative endonuclease